MFAPVHHHLEGLAAERFRSLAAQLRRMQRQGSPAERLDALCRDEIRWAATAHGLNGSREKYEACARLLTDLAKLRWRIVPDGFGIELAAPNARRVPATEIAAYKDSVRQELASQLRQQFAAKSVRDFIRRMEKPIPSAKKRSVLELIADGRELRTRLLAASETHGAERTVLCTEAVHPYLQLVEPDAISLYLHGASQYNRGRLPAGVISPEQQEIRYQPMGETGGFGTVQFSADTVEAVEKVVTSSKGYRHVNSVFGEGRSPKLRKLRTDRENAFTKMAA